MIYIGIDPGKSGALAVLREDGKVTIFKFEELAYDLILRDIANSKQRSACVLERVSAMPKQGVTSMFNFGVNFGFIQGLLTAHNIPFELVTPRKWKSEFGITADKNSSITVAQRLFPAVSLLRTEKCKKPDDGIAEALLLAEYARRKLGGKSDER